MSELRSQILAVADSPVEEVDVPEWGVTVGIKSMTAAARASVMELAQGGQDGLDAGHVQAMWGKTLVSCLVDPDSGDPIFTNDDMAALMDKSAAVIERLWQQCFTNSSMMEDDVDEAGKDS